MAASSKISWASLDVTVFARAQGRRPFIPEGSRRLAPDREAHPGKRNPKNHSPARSAFGRSHGRERLVRLIPWVRCATHGEWPEPLRGRNIDRRSVGFWWRIGRSFHHTYVVELQVAIHLVNVRRD